MGFRLSALHTVRLLFFYCVICKSFEVSSESLDRWYLYTGMFLFSLSSPLFEVWLPSGQQATHSSNASFLSFVFLFVLSPFPFVFPSLSPASSATLAQRTVNRPFFTIWSLTSLTSALTRSTGIARLRMLRQPWKVGEMAVCLFCVVACLWFWLCSVSQLTRRLSYRWLPLEEFISIFSGFMFLFLLVVCLELCPLFKVFQTYWLTFPSLSTCRR